ncbi:MAG: hypothetical protein KC582_00365 [Candidatus Magasanikbacteria bacterium]|nr:hypothetical protein [Candidatus Magasanikbacteria bacterium]
MSEEVTMAQALKNARNVKEITDLLSKYGLNDEYEAFIKKMAVDPSQKGALGALADLKRALYSEKLSTFAHSAILIEKIDLFVMNHEKVA